MLVIILTESCTCCEGEVYFSLDLKLLISEYIAVASGVFSVPPLNL